MAEYRVRAEDQITEIWDGKNWKDVDFAAIGWLVFEDSPNTRKKVFVADLKGGGNKLTVWLEGDFPPFRIEAP